MLSNLDQKEFLMQVYSECNSYFREQPKSRDQVILFYSAVCAFYLSHLSQLSKTMFIFLTFAMIVLGFICSFIVISFRSWIIQYGKAADVVGRLLISQQKFESLDEISNFIRKECHKYSSHKKSFFLRTGNVIVLGFCFITLAPFAAIYEHLSTSSIWMHILTLFGAFIYFSFLVFLCWKKVNQAEQMNDKTWIIRFKIEEKTASIDSIQQ